MSRYAQIILPLALNQTYTYEIPESLEGLVQPGSRVEIQFGKKKVYAGIVNSLTDEKGPHAVKSIMSILDEAPILSQRQIKLWNWIAGYYMCDLGEVMLAGLPAGLKLASETIIVRNEDLEADASLHTEEEFLVLEALEFQSELTISQIQQILDKKTVFPFINKMMKKNLIDVKEELNQKYKPKEVSVISLNEIYKVDIQAAIALVEKYDNQVNAILAYIQLSKNLDYVTKSNLQKKSRRWL